MCVHGIYLRTIGVYPNLNFEDFTFFDADFSGLRYNNAAAALTVGDGIKRAAIRLIHKTGAV